MIIDLIKSVFYEFLSYFVPERMTYEITGSCKKCGKLSMPVEVTDKDKEYDIRAELPGVKKEDLDIDVEKNYITIRAKKEEEKKEDNKFFKKSEFKYGEFARSVYLPQEINIEKTEAKLEHGVLKIEAPKLYETKDSVKKLTVK